MTSRPYVGDANPECCEPYLRRAVDRMPTKPRQLLCPWCKTSWVRNDYDRYQQEKPAAAPNDWEFDT